MHLSHSALYTALLATAVQAKIPYYPRSSNNTNTCTTYTVKDGDSCASIAAGSRNMTIKDLSTYNDVNTWGWNGCGNLTTGMRICLSKGKPPLPSTVEGAVCGPIVPNTKLNTSMNLFTMNPCPLDACCTATGECGITPEFCTRVNSSTGNNGISAPGKKGCVSGCGTTVTGAATAPTYMNIGYYESWNYDRSCLNMRVKSVNTTEYTHMHWAFGSFSKDYTITITDSGNQWLDFIKIKGIKKILSIGEWGYIGDNGTSGSLRQAMSPANADMFALKLSSFIMEEELDGVDINWEYPGAIDLPGVPPGLPSDGPNYLAFLKLLRAKLRADKTISIAAPPAYRHLKAFPIAEMADIVDYIVYMTFDLQGQWDFGNSTLEDGCSNGDCLRSHVNLTETMYSLAMMTKAQVPAKKVVIGLPSYGRSFAMAQKGCTDRNCKYQGPFSKAIPGECTQTSGLLANAEIENLIALGTILDDNSTRTWYDTDSNSNILVYNDTQWVSFIDETTRQSRRDYYKRMNFLGTADWAMDMREWHGDDESNPQGLVQEDDMGDPGPPVNCTAHFDTLEALNASASSIPADCQMYYTVTTLSNVLSNSLKQYSDLIAKDYDSKFQTYAKSIADSAGKSMHDFIYKNGSSYFSCVVAESTLCCDSCSTQGGPNPCKYCNKGQCYHKVSKRELDDMDNYQNASLALRSDGGGQHLSVLTTTIQNVTEPCPPDYSQRGPGPDHPFTQSVYWNLLPEKADKFFEDLMTSTGIAKNKTKFDRYARGNVCAPSSHPDDKCWATGMDFNIPVPDGYSVSDVANPKDMVQKALTNAGDLQKQVKSAIFQLEITAYGGDISELIDSLSIPILLISDAVDSMASVESTADKLDDEKKHQLIIEFVGAVLAFIPIAGQVLATVTGVAEIAAVLTVVGALGDAAMGVYSIVEDPKHPLMGIMSIILAPLALTNLSKVSKASDLRRSMNDDDLVKMGGKLSPRLKLIQNVVGVCKKKL